MQGWCLRSVAITSNIFQIPSMWMTFSKLTAVTIVSAGILKRPSDMIPITTSSASVVPDSWLRGCSDSNLAVTCPDGFHKVTLHCGEHYFEEHCKRDVCGWGLWIQHATRNDTAKVFVRGRRGVHV